MHKDHGLEAFCDALWLEDGLSPATRLAYGRDLKDFMAWLARKGATFATAHRETVEDYLLSCESEGLSKATRARRLTAIRIVSPNADPKQVAKHAERAQQQNSGEERHPDFLPIFDSYAEVPAAVSKEIIAKIKGE